jgi:hypothetical protein
MPEHEAHATITANGEPMHPAVAFEAQDVSVGGIERVGLGLAIVVVVVLIICAGLIHFLTRVPPLGTPEIAAGVSAADHPLPPAPRMQGIPGDDVPPPEQQREFRAAAAAQLHSYGWTDAQQGVAHIPIEDAMDQLLKTGLPQATPPVAAPAKPQAAAAKGKKSQ